MVSPFEIYPRTSHLRRIGFQSTTEIERDMGGREWIRRPALRDNAGNRRISRSQVWRTRRASWAEFNTPGDWAPTSVHITVVLAHQPVFVARYSFKVEASDYLPVHPQNVS